MDATNEAPMITLPDYRHPTRRLFSLDPQLRSRRLLLPEISRMQNSAHNLSGGMASPPSETLRSNRALKLSATCSRMLLKAERSHRTSTGRSTHSTHTFSGVTLRAAWVSFSTA